MNSSSSDAGTPSRQVRQVRWSGHSDIGRRRANNEDSFLGLQFDGREIFRLGKVGEAPAGPHDFVFAVSDGMGGAQAGEFASRITVDKILQLLPQSIRQEAAGLEAGRLEVLTQLFGEIHGALQQMGRSYPECRGMGATLSLCWFSAEWLHYAHIGDSRIYYMEPGEGTLKQLSRDDTHIGWLRQQGKISEHEARLHPRRTALQKALGADYQFVDPQVGSVFLQPGDLYFLCTDGLVDGFYDSQIADRLREHAQRPQSGSAAEEIVRTAVANAGTDNVTAMLVEIG